jgi:chromate reductase, NAD(P)H dehydrogenase (quinone)
MRILAISGSLRSASSNRKLLAEAARLAPDGIEVVFYRGLGELPHFNPDLDEEGMTPPAAVAGLRAQISSSQALLISTPEYAHGFPGSLKNALDWLVSYPDFAGKPVALINASPAGKHAQAQLIEVLQTMSARVLFDACLLAPFAKNTLDANGRLTDPALEAALRASLEKLARAAAH